MDASARMVVMEVPTVPSTMADYAPNGEGIFFNSTSAVYHGNVVRGILPKGTSFTELDYIGYPGPNGFCWHPASGPWTTTREPDQIVDWVFGELSARGTHQPMFGWIPYRDSHALLCR
jgi:hypothetical protein